MLESDKPFLTAAFHQLPFEKLSPRDFERLTLWLVEREGFVKVEALGAAGTDQGLDIVAFRDEQRWGFQCKRWRQFRTSEALAELDQVLALPREERPVVYVFVVPSDVSKKARDKLRAHSQKTIECQFWAGTELDKKVKRQPDLLREFFQISAHALPTRGELPQDKKVLLSILRARAEIIVQNFDLRREQIERADYIPGLQWGRGNMQLQEAKESLLQEMGNARQQFGELHEKHLQAILDEEFTLAHELVNQIHSLLYNLNNAQGSAFRSPIGQYTIMDQPPSAYAKEYPGSPIKSLDRETTRLLFKGWEQDDFDIRYVESELDDKLSIALLHGYNEKAVEICDLLGNTRPDDPRIFFWRGVALHRLGRYDKALKALDCAIELGRDDSNSQVPIRLRSIFVTDVYYTRGNVLEELGRYEEALREYGRAQHCRETYRAQGRLLDKLGRYEEALKAFDKDKDFPDIGDTLVKFSRARILTKLGRRRDAIQAFTEVIKRNSFQAEAHLERANLLDQCGRHAQAVQDRDKAVKIVFERGDSRALVGDHYEAIAAFDQALQLRPDFAEAHCLRGISLRAIGRYDEALTGFDQAINLQRNYAKAYTYRGFTLLELNRPNDALADTNQAIHFEGMFTHAYEASKAYECRGLVLQALGRLEESLEAYGKAAKVLEENKVNSYRIYLRQGTLLIQLSRHEEALMAYEKSIKQYPSNPEAYYYRALLLNKIGRYREATEACDKAIQLKDDYAAAYHARGEAFLGLAKCEEAIMAYSQAVALEPNLSEAYHSRSLLYAEIGELNLATKDAKRVLSLTTADEETHHKALELLKELE